jgi:hypothetical protein
MTRIGLEKGGDKNGLEILLKAQDDIPRRLENLFILIQEGFIKATQDMLAVTSKNMT